MHLIAVLMMLKLSEYLRTNDWDLSDVKRRFSCHAKGISYYMDCANIIALWLEDSQIYCFIENKKNAPLMFWYILPKAMRPSQVIKEDTGTNLLRALFLVTSVHNFD